jgi:hypothetical protein
LKFKREEKQVEVGDVFEEDDVLQRKIFLIFFRAVKLKNHCLLDQRKFKDISFENFLFLFIKQRHELIAPQIKQKNIVNHDHLFQDIAHFFYNVRVYFHLMNLFFEKKFVVLLH